VSRSSAVVVVVALLSARVAHAQTPIGSGEQCYCEANTNHPDMPVACDASCECWDSCGGGSSTGTGPKPHLSKGQQDAFVALVWLIMLPVGPGHMTETFFGDKHQMGPSKAQSRAAWAKLMGTIKAYEALGKSIKKRRAQLASAEDVGESLPDAPASFAWNPPHLVPSTPFQCDKAWMELPLGYDWPVAGFSSAEALCNSCPCSERAAYSAPDSATGTCAAETFMCTGYNVCCPRAFPVYNPCDQNCYAGSYFGFSPTSEGLRCNHYLKCNG
jgi:hypothetical protein